MKKYKEYMEKLTVRPETSERFLLAMHQAENKKEDIKPAVPWYRTRMFRRIASASAAVIALAVLITAFFPGVFGRTGAAKNETQATRSAEAAPAVPSEPALLPVQEDSNRTDGNKSEHAYSGGSEIRNENTDGAALPTKSTAASPTSATAATSINENSCMIIRIGGNPAKTPALGSADERLVRKWLESGLLKSVGQTLPEPTAAQAPENVFFFQIDGQVYSLDYDAAKPDEQAALSRMAELYGEAP